MFSRVRAAWWRDVNPARKQDCMDKAELVDAWRVAPRVIIGAYLLLLGWLTAYIPVKYFALPAPERTAWVTGFCSVILGAAYGAFPFIVQIYMSTGRDWAAALHPEVVITPSPSIVINAAPAASSMPS